MYKGKAQDTAALADLLVLTHLHLRGPTRLEDNLTFTVLHLVKVVVDTMGKIIGEPMENHIPDGKKFIHLLQSDGAFSPAHHLMSIENELDQVILHLSIFLTCFYETKV